VKRITRAHLRRIAKFQSVAWLGTLVNLGFLWALKGQLNVPLVAAGACAIELAIIHNFTWHYFLTWRDRVAHTARDYFTRLLKYNLVTASIDFVINLTVLYVLVKFFGIHYLVANIIGMLGGPIFKFLLNEFLIFGRKPLVDENSGSGDSHG
jgi:dolichol-phosphate mannosyltransferase